jgi:hypothetical protein
VWRSGRVEDFNPEGCTISSPDGATFDYDLFVGKLREDCWKIPMSYNTLENIPSSLSELV